MSQVLCLDFESAAIQPRPNYPPKPCGIAWYNGTEKGYFAWGHPTENNSFEEDAIKRIQNAIDFANTIIFHNASFDVAILEEKWGFNIPWHKVQCTMVMAFLDNPHGELSLKPLAEQHLGMPPQERDAVKDWLVSHGVCRDTKDWGAYISYAPGELVGRYAIGDVQRTYELYHYYLKRWADRPHLLAAYKREMALMPCILEMDQRGVHIDTAKLQVDLDLAYKELDWLDNEICKILGADIDVDSNDDLANAIDARGLSKGFASTAKGHRSVAKESLIAAISDPTLLGHLLVRNSLATCIRTFMHPWLEQAKANKDRLYIRWNQVRNYSDTGARTGRLSSSPNLQNVPTEWEKLRSQLDNIGYKLHTELPQVRQYLLPDKGNIFISLDYASQEMRLLAHFAGGKLLNTLLENPKEDVHMVAANIADITRKVAKTLGFAVLYGAGIGKIAESLSVSADAATIIKAKYLAAMPEIKELQNTVSYRGRTNQPIRTLGGREYYCEKPKYVEGRLRSFEYKLTNYLVQGSAADQTKMAMIDYYHKSKHGVLTLSVHDQLVIQCAPEHVKEEQALLNECMTKAFAEILDAPFITDASIGSNFAEV